MNGEKKTRSCHRRVLIARHYCPEAGRFSASGKSSAAEIAVRHDVEDVFRMSRGDFRKDRFAGLIPMMVTAEEKASLRLFTASGSAV